MKRVLMLASVASMIERFNMSNIELLQGMGYQVDVACNFLTDSAGSDERIEAFQKRLEQANIQYYQIDFSRKVRKLRKNGKAYRQVKTLLQNNQYEFLHCHSPIGGVVGRVAGKRTGTKVIYTAHGFHFYQGAPAINWMVYYPIERFLSRWTDVLITINQEDYQRAKEHFHMKKLKYVPGVGVDLDKFGACPIDVAKKKEGLNLPGTAQIVLSVGELNQNKNHATIIRTIAKTDSAVHYLVAGRGDRKAYLENLAKDLGVDSRVHLLDYRSDVDELYQVADIFVFPSFREGLSLSLMEAMASGLSCVVSDIRGNADLIRDGEGGYLCAPTDADAFADAIHKLLMNKERREEMGRNNRRVIQGFSIETVKEKMAQIYLTGIETRKDI